MAMKISMFQLSTTSLPQTRNFPNPTFVSNRRNKFPNISCIKKDLTDAALALDLAITVEKMNTHLEQKEKAMKKSKQLLFTELCHCLSLEEDEMDKKWRKMKEEEKWVLVHKFVNEWDVNFHPLSVRSVKQMVDEYLQYEEKSSSPMFPGLKRIFGISEDI